MSPALEEFLRVIRSRRKLTEEECMELVRRLSIDDIRAMTDAMQETTERLERCASITKS